MQYVQEKYYIMMRVAAVFSWKKIRATTEVSPDWFYDEDDRYIDGDNV